MPRKIEQLGNGWYRVGGQDGDKVHGLDAAAELAGYDSAEDAESHVVDAPGPAEDGDEDDGTATLPRKVKIIGEFERRALLCALAEHFGTDKDIKTDLGETSAAKYDAVFRQHEDGTVTFQVVLLSELTPEAALGRQWGEDRYEERRTGMGWDVAPKQPKKAKEANA